MCVYLFDPESRECNYDGKTNTIHVTRFDLLGTILAKPRTKLIQRNSQCIQSAGLLPSQGLAVYCSKYSFVQVNINIII
jgi:hypothetical protein